MNIVNVGSEVCEPIGGTGVTLLWALHSDFEDIKQVKDICSDSGNAAATFAELAQITEDHVLKAGKKLHKVNFTSETGAVVSTQIGDKKRRLFENSISFEIPGSDATLLGFSRYIKNQDIICFIQEFGSGNYRQLGSKILPAWVETQEGGIEAPIEGKNGITITFKDKSKGPAPIYSGELLSYVDSE